MLTIKALLLCQGLCHADHHVGIIGIAQQLPPSGASLHLTFLDAPTTLKGSPQGIPYRSAHQRAQEFRPQNLLLHRWSISLALCLLCSHSHDI